MKAAREAAQSSWCSSNFKQIALALHNYHNVYGSLPPAYLTDAKGRPTLSWRVLILPFMEQQALYNQFNLSEPWDGPNNIKLLSSIPGPFKCPDHPDDQQTGRSKCAAITGPGTMFPGATSVRFSDVSDGTANTVMLAEVESVTIPWTAPIDLDIRTMSFVLNDPTKPSISSPHFSGPLVTMGNGMFRHSLPRNLAPATLKGLLTIAGGERIDLDEVLSGK